MVQFLVEHYFFTRHDHNQRSTLSQRYVIHEREDEECSTVGITPASTAESFHSRGVCANVVVVVVVVVVVDDDVTPTRGNIQTTANLRQLAAIFDYSTATCPITSAQQQV